MDIVELKKEIKASVEPDLAGRIIEAFEEQWNEGYSFAVDMAGPFLNI